MRGRVAHQGLAFETWESRGLRQPRAGYRGPVGSGFNPGTTRANTLADPPYSHMRLAKSDLFFDERIGDLHIRCFLFDISCCGPTFEILLYNQAIYSADDLAR
jgi:hypothetical protein